MIDMPSSVMIRYNITIYDSYDQCHIFKGMTQSVNLRQGIKKEADF